MGGCNCAETRDDDDQPVEPDVVTCGSCDRSWCDPCPAALCHFCNGRGHSFAEFT